MRGLCIYLTLGPRQRGQPRDSQRAGARPCLRAQGHTDKIEGVALELNCKFLWREWAESEIMYWQCVYVCTHIIHTRTIKCSPTETKFFARWLSTPLTLTYSHPRDVVPYRLNLPAGQGGQQHRDCEGWKEGRGRARPNFNETEAQRPYILKDSRI